MNICSLNVSISRTFVCTHNCSTFSIPNFVFSTCGSSSFLYKSSRNRRSHFNTLLNKNNTSIVSSSVALGSQISEWAQEYEEKENFSSDNEEEGDKELPWSDAGGGDTEARFSGFEEQTEANGGKMESRVSEEGKSILEGENRVAEEGYGYDKAEEEKRTIDNMGGMGLADSSARELGLGEGFTFPLEAKVYVGNFMYDTDSQKLADLFSNAGTVELAEVVFDRITGKSRGFGFVTMSTPEEAANAIKMFNLYEFNGRTLIVNKAVSKGMTGDMGRRLQFGIFVGNLSADSSKEQLKELFSAHGTVIDSQVITDRETGAPRGFGFVNMASDIEQSNAIAALDGQTFNGRVLTVNKATPKGAAVPVFTAFIANIPWEVDETQLQQIFSQHGRVVGLRVVCDRETGLSKGYGFVKLSTEDELNSAISALDGKLFAGRMIRVLKAVPKPEWVNQTTGPTEGVSTPYGGRFRAADTPTGAPGQSFDRTRFPSQPPSPRLQRTKTDSDGWDRAFSDQVVSESQDRNLGHMVEPWGDDDDDESYQQSPSGSEDYDL